MINIQENATAGTEKGDDLCFQLISLDQQMIYETHLQRSLMHYIVVNYYLCNFQ